MTNSRKHNNPWERKRSQDYLGDNYEVFDIVTENKSNRRDRLKDKKRDNRRYDYDDEE